MRVQGVDGATAGLALFIAWALASAALGCSRVDNPQLRLGKNALEDGQASEAIAHLSEAIAQQPDSSEAYSLRGQAHFQRREYADAVDDLQLARQLASGTFRDFEMLARAALATGDFEGAIEAIAGAAAAGRLDAPLKTVEGQARLALLEPELAHKAFTEALALNPASRDAKRGNAAALIQLGRFKEADRVLTECIQAATSDAAAYWLRAQAREKIGLKALAEADKGMAIELASSPGSAQAAEFKRLVDPAASRDDSAVLNRLGP